MTTYYKLNERQRELLLRIYHAGGAAPTRTDLRVAISLQKLGLIEIDLEHAEIGLTGAGSGVAINLVDPAFADAEAT